MEDLIDSGWKETIRVIIVCCVGLVVSLGAVCKWGMTSQPTGVGTQVLGRALRIS
jgi:hypothetical protein